MAAALVAAAAGRPASVASQRLSLAGRQLLLGRLHASCRSLAVAAATGARAARTDIGLRRAATGCLLRLPSTTVASRGITSGDIGTGPRSMPAPPFGLAFHCRHFAAKPQLSPEASRALGNIKENIQRKQVQLTRAQKKNFQGNLRRFKLMGGRPEFHNIDRNKHGRIFEPWHNFEVVITSSKNNCYITVKNKGWGYRCVIQSHAGNVGYRKAMKKSEAATQRIALNIARKLKRLGVTCAEVTFRRIMKVETCLQAFQSVGLQITRLTHIPRLPKGIPPKPRKQRRV